MAPSKAKRAAPARCGNDPKKIEQLGGRLDHSNNANRARLQHLAAALHALGPRPLFEFLREVENGADLRSRLEVYARYPASFIHANGGDVIPPSIFVIPGGRK